MASNTVESISRQAENLPLPDYIDLIERLVHRLHEKCGLQTAEHDWDDLYGLGKGLWNDEDAQNYVERLREDR